ncbi:hypothetical protein E4U13_000248, partial [Claviceps humidiphila]
LNIEFCWNILLTSLVQASKFKWVQESQQSDLHRTPTLRETGQQEMIIRDGPLARTLN